MFLELLIRTFLFDRYTQIPYWLGVTVKQQLLLPQITRNISQGFILMWVLIPKYWIQNSVYPILYRITLRLRH